MSKKRTSIEYLKGVGQKGLDYSMKNLRLALLTSFCNFFQTDILTELNFIGQKNYQK